MSSNLVPLDRLQDLIRDFMNTAAANAISQQQLRPSDVTRVPDHSTDTSPIDSQSSPQDDFATLRTSISTNSGLGATTIALHPAAEAGQTNFLKVDAAPKDGSIGPRRSANRSEPPSEQKPQFKLEAPSRSPSIEIIYTRRVTAAAVRGVTSKATLSTRPTPNESPSSSTNVPRKPAKSSAIGSHATNQRKGRTLAEASPIAETAEAHTERHSVSETHQQQQIDFPIPCLSTFKTISSSPIRPIKQRPTAADFFPATPKSADSPSFPAEHITGAIAQLIEEEKSKVRSREQELLDRYKSFSDLDLAAFASNGPGAGKPADDLAKLESYLSSTTEAIYQDQSTPHESSALSSSPSLRPSITSPPASITTPSFSPPQNLPEAPPVRFTSQTARPENGPKLGYSSVLLASPVQDGEQPSFNPPTGPHKRRYGYDHPAKALKRQRRATAPSNDARPIATARGQAWEEKKMIQNSRKRAGPQRRVLPSVFYMLDSYRPKYDGAD